MSCLLMAPVFPSLQWYTRYNVRDEHSLWMKTNKIKLDTKNLLKIATNMYNAFWNPPSPSTPTNDHLQAIITERKLKPDITPFLQTFSALYRLVSKEAADACREDVVKFVDMLLEMCILPTADSLLPTDEGTFNLVHLCMESGRQSPFLALYSSASKESFNHQVGRGNSPSNVGSVQCAEFHLCLYQPKN